MDQESPSTADLVDRLAFALEEDRMEGDDSELPGRLLQEADRIRTKKERE